MIDAVIAIGEIDYMRSFQALFPMVCDKCQSMETENYLVRLLQKVGNASTPVLTALLAPLPEGQKRELLCSLAGAFGPDLTKALNHVLAKDKVGQGLQLGGTALTPEGEEMFLSLSGIQVDYKTILHSETVREKAAWTADHLLRGYIGKPMAQRIAKKGVDHAAALAGAMPGTSERVVLSVLEQPKTQAAILRLAEDALESRGLCLRLLGMRFQPSRPAPAPVRQRLHFSHELEEALLDSLSAYLRAAVAMKEGER